MSHSLSHEQLSAYLDGELSPEEHVAVERILAAEPEAQAELDELRELQAQIRAIPTPEFPSVADSVMARLKTESAPTQPIGSAKQSDNDLPANVVPFTRRPGFLATLALGAVAAVAVLMVNMGDDDPMLTRGGDAPMNQAGAPVPLPPRSEDSAATSQQRQRSAAANEANQARGILNPEELRRKQEAQPTQDPSEFIARILQEGAAQRQKEHQELSPEERERKEQGSQALIDLLRQSAQRQQDAEPAQAASAQTESPVIFTAGLSATKMTLKSAAVEGRYAPSVDDNAPSGSEADMAEVSTDQPLFRINLSYSRTGDDQNAVLPMLLTRSQANNVDYVGLTRGDYGKVRLMVNIDATGKVTGVEDTGSNMTTDRGKQQLIDLKRAIQTWTFRPARIGVQPTAFQLKLEIPAE